MKPLTGGLFNFKTTYFHAFVAGIWVSLAANLFTTAVLSQTLPMSTCKLYGIVVLLFVGSIGAFGVSGVLELARCDWESKGSPKDPTVMRQDYIERGGRANLLWFLFSLSVLSPMVALILLLR